MKGLQSYKKESIEMDIMALKELYIFLSYFKRISLLSECFYCHSTGFISIIMNT